MVLMSDGRTLMTLRRILAAPASSTLFPYPIVIIRKDHPDLLALSSVDENRFRSQHKGRIEGSGGNSG